jgi:hypothetical protein
MSVIYYPQATSVSQRVVSGSAYTELILGVYPNTIFYFDTSSLIQSASLGVLPYTSSWSSQSVSASYAGTSSFALNAGGSSNSSSWASQSFSSSYAVSASFAPSQPVASASWSSQSLSSVSASYVSSLQPYITLLTSSTNWITCSFTDAREYISITFGQLYNFTCSNIPTAGQLSEVSLFINNTAATQTCSLSFPSNWIFLGSKPNAITASKSAVLSLQSYGPTVQVAGFSVQY